MREATDPRIEQAIIFLVQAVTTSGKNPKPVLFHSLKVAIHLYDLNYENDLVVAAILHDVIEDSETTKAEIRSNFGIHIADLVEALSFNPEITDRFARAKAEIDKAKEYGREALIIKAADIIDNSHFYGLSGNGEIFEYLVKKMSYFVSTSKSELIKEPLWLDLIRQYEELMGIKSGGGL